MPEGDRYENQDQPRRIERQADTRAEKPEGKAVVRRRGSVPRKIQRPPAPCVRVCENFAPSSPSHTNGPNAFASRRP